MRRTGNAALVSCSVLLAALLLACGTAQAADPPKWVAALYVEAQRMVGLRWTPVAGATKYKVLRSTTAGSGYEEITSTNAPQYFDQDVEAGETYYYVLQAVFGADVSAKSKEKMVKVPGQKKVEVKPPTWVNINVRQKKEFGKSTFKVNMAWVKDPNPVIVAYNVYRSETPGKDYQLIGSVSEAQYVDTAVQQDKTYYYVISALDSQFQETGYSPEKQVTLKVEKAKAKRMKMARSGPPGGPYYYGGGPAGLPQPSYAGFGEVFDEVWVIQKLAKTVQPAPGEEWPGSGELRTVIDRKTVPVPLEHTEVTADVTGYIARVLVKQAYRNPYDSKIEAVYVFPLPQNAAVSEFVMQIGDRRIRGIIREKEEAKKIYDAAKRQGYVASLLTQERPNIFTQKVANIEPGKAIDIEITYFNTLSYSQGEYTFVFPMVVGPRFNPPGFSSGVGAVGRSAAGTSGQKTEVSYLRPDERSGHDIMVTVNIDAGVELERIYSSSHAVEIDRRGSRATVRLAPADTLPNKDLVLRYGVAGKKVKSAMMIDRDKRGGYFTLMLQPPANLEHLRQGGQEMVFVLDTSGSMNGWPIQTSKAVMRRALKKLRPDDTFQLVQFANGSSLFAPKPVAATAENIERGLAWLEGLQGAGGTMMLEGVKAGLDFPHDESRLRTVSFLTDGYIGNEEQIFAAVAEKLGPARIFSFGIGNSVNRYLIEGLARLGRGAVAYVLTGDSSTEAVDLFYDRIRHPALTDISIDWGGMEVTDVYPKRVPDLFVGRPVILTGRFTGRGETQVRVRGRTAGERQEFTLNVALDDPEVRHTGISRVWARARIAELTDTMTRGRGDMTQQIRETAIDYSLMSQYTAFVAVDSSHRTEGKFGTTVNVPVPVPEGVRYETTVQE